MGLGIAELDFPDSINGVHVPERLYVLSVFEAAAILMEIYNSGAGENGGYRKRKRTPATKKQRIMKTESPFTLKLPMCIKDRVEKLSTYAGGAGDRGRNRKRKRSPAPARKKQSKKKTESPLIPEIPAAIKDRTRKKKSAYSGGGDDDRERKRNRRRGPAPAPTTKNLSKKKTEPPSASEIPAAMRDRIEQMGGSNIELVIEKQLNDTDLSKNQGRLLLPPRMVRTEFVTEEEKIALSENEDKKKKGMKVEIMDDEIEEKSIYLKKWKNGSEEAYCLMTKWNSFVEESGLRTGNLIQLWSFRRDCFDEEKEANVSKLCFAMVRL